MHSCPSDSENYICGDLGYCSLCPDNRYCENGMPRNKPANAGEQQNNNQMKPPEFLEVKPKIAAPEFIKHYDIKSGHHTLLSRPPAEFMNKTILSWKAPTTNADGTPLHDHDGYTLYYGQRKQSLGDKERNHVGVTKNVTSIVMYNFSSGEWCFEATAYDSSGNKSKFSNSTCKNIQ
jgi:hypothetical protein